MIALLLVVGICVLLFSPAGNVYAESNRDLLPRLQENSTVACDLEVSIIAAPFATVDSNNPGGEGPQVAMLAARITNRSGSELASVQIHIGNGVTPGQFPTSAGGALSLLDPTDATHFLVALQAGESITSYWPVTYPPTFDVPYGYTIWVTTPTGCTASQSIQITTQSEISASANKLLPTGSFMLITPETVAPGGQVSVQITGFTLGTIGQGPKPLSPYDAWLQPVGNLDFDPTCLRLIRSEVTLNSISPTPFVDRLYFSGLTNYSANSADTVRYTFLALRQCSTTIQPYQEAASGTQEKYNSDYSSSTSRISITSAGQSQLVLDLDADTTAVDSTGIISVTGKFYTLGESIGYPDNGSPLVITARIPSGKTYVKGSAAVSIPAVLQYSTDARNTWVNVLPGDNAQPTDIRWLLEEPVDSTVATVNYKVQVDDSYNGTPIDLSIEAGLLNSDSLTTTSVVVGGEPTPTPTPTPTATPDSDEVQSGSEGGLESGPVDFDPADLIGLIGEDNALARSTSAPDQPLHKARLLSAMTLRLEDLMPQQGPVGTTPKPAVPVDVLAITSAPDAKAVDFVDADGKVKAVALGVVSVGAPYEHDYGVCNRFKGYTIDSITPVSIDGRWFWHSRSTHPMGNSEEALLFHIFVDDSNKRLHVDSRWVRDGYPAQMPFQFDYVFNMQVWSSNLTTSADLLRRILAHLPEVDGGQWQATFHTHAQPASPHVYVRQADVEADMLRIVLVNGATTAQKVEIDGSWRSYLDREDTTPFALSMMAPPGETRLTLALPALLDVTLYARSGGFVDKIYSGSGLWFALQDDAGTVGQVVQGHCRPLDTLDPRDLFLAGCVDFTAQQGAAPDKAGFGRTLNPNGRAVDVSPYRALRFWAQGDGSPVRIRLATANITDGDAYQLIFTPGNEWRQYVMPLADFRQQGFGAPVAWTGKDVTAVLWTNAETTHNPFSLAIDGISFTNAGLIKTTSLPVDSADQSPRRVSMETAAGTLLHSATLFYSLDEGESFASTPMLANGAAFAGTLPGAPLGSDLLYYIDAIDVNGYISRAPVDAPNSFFRYRVEDRPGLLVDDFSATSLENRVGGVTGLFHNQDAGGALRVYRRGGVLRFDYDVSQGGQFAGYFTRLNQLDLSPYTSINLRLRGSAGGEQVLLGLRDGAGFEPKVSLGSYLSGGIGEDWRWVQIPLAAFDAALDRTNLHSLSFTFAHGAGPATGQLYIDEIRFSSGPVLFVVDTFDGNNAQINAQGGASWTTAPGGSLSATLELQPTTGQQDFSPAGMALRLDYSVNPGGYALWHTDLKGTPDRGLLTFWVKGIGTHSPNLYLSDGQQRVRVALHGFVQPRQDWQFVAIPLKLFADQGVILKNVTALEIAFEFAAGQGVLWLDNIAVGPQTGLAVDQRTLHMRNNAERSVSLRSTSGARWQAASNQPWILVQGSGYGSTNLHVRTLNWGMVPGNYQGTVTLTDEAGATETILINLTLTEAGPPLQRLYIPTVHR